MNINADKTDKILGLFAQSHLQYKLLSNPEAQPTLTEMTAKALEVLKKNENGFVLIVEGGRIDHAHHESRARLSLEETLEFSKVVDYVKKNTNEDDTLIVVTADHGHVFTVGGYPVS
jgi:alkaline phosphatase